MIIELLNGPPGTPGAQGPAGPQGPPGALANVSGDISIDVQNVVTVQGIQGAPVSSTAPAANQILSYSGTQYQPTSFSAGTY